MTICEVKRNAALDRVRAPAPFLSERLLMAKSPFSTSFRFSLSSLLAAVSSWVTMPFGPTQEKWRRPTPFALLLPRI